MARRSLVILLSASLILGLLGIAACAQSDTAQTQDGSSPGAILSNLAGWLQTVRNDVTDNSKTLEQVKSELSKLQGMLDTLRNDLNSTKHKLSKEDQEIWNTIDQLQAKIKKLSEESWRSKIVEVIGDVKKLSNQVAKLSDSVESNSQALASIEKNYEKLKSRVEHNSAAIDSLQTTDTALKDKVNQAFGIAIAALAAAAVGLAAGFGVI